MWYTGAFRLHSIKTIHHPNQRLLLLIFQLIQAYTQFALSIVKFEGYKSGTLFRTGLILVAAIFFISNIAAQQGRQFSFTHYNTANGSISNQVNAVVQDKEGYIWTATTDGLQRYDGTRYKVFRHKKNDPTSLPSNPV